VIGLVALDLEDPFFSHAAAEAVRQLHDAGYAITIAAFTRRTPSTADVRALLEQDLRALVVLGGGSLDWVAPFHKHRVPIVRIGAGRADPRIAEIRVDEERGFGLVVEHLLQLGHRTFAFVGAAQDVHARRRDLVKKLLARHGLKLHPSRAMLPDPDVYEAGLQGGEMLARGNSAESLTAIICSSDAVAFGVLRGLAASGWRAPERVSVTGFDDLPIARLAHPPLTTVRQPLPAMVADALRAVREGAPRDRVSPHAPRLIVRASTAPPVEQSI
jgi:LacI family transcriptional regulator